MADSSPSSQSNAERLERRRQLRGLFLLVIGVIVFTALGAGGCRVYTAGWWRLW